MPRFRYYPPERRLAKVAARFRAAIRRIFGRGDDPAPALPKSPSDDGDDDAFSTAGVPRRPAPSAGSASAAVGEPTDDANP